MSATRNVTPPEVDVDSNEGGTEWEDLFDSKSLASSVQDYEYTNGRRYHAYRAGAYMLPNDETEQSREHLMHHLWRSLIGGALTRTELKNPKRIFDVGTGTGIWALEMADMYPNAKVVGIDLSPIQPNYVPENCHFYVDDVEEEWDAGLYDFIHVRALMGAIKDWPRFFQQAFDHLEPGGQLELQELDAWIHCQPPGVTPPWIQGWNQNLNAAFTAWGKGLNVAAKHAQWMRDAGFVNVQDQVHHVPIGPWAKDPILKELGKFHLAVVLESVDSYTLAMMTEFLGKSVEETQITIEMIKGEFKQKKYHMFGKYHFITATKPQ